MTAFALGLLVSLQIAQPTEVFVVKDSARLDLETSQGLDANRVGAPNERGEILVPAKPVKLRAVRDEVLSFQLVVTGEPGPRLLKSREFRTKDGKAQAISLKFYEQVGVRVSEPSLNDYVRSLGPGLYPDPLIPTSTVVIKKQPQVSAIWVDIWIKPEAAAGKMLGGFSVGADENLIEVEIEVVDETLPLVDVAGLGAVNFGSLLERRQRSKKRFLEWIQMAHAHHFNIEFVRSRPGKDANGTILWEEWADEMGPLFDGRAFTKEFDYDGPRKGTPIQRFVLPHTDWWPVDETRDNRPTSGKVWSRELKQWETLALSRGWLKRPHGTDFIIFINSLDEPNTPAKFESLLSYQALINQAQLENRDHIHFRMDGGFGGDIPSWDDKEVIRKLGGLVDDWNLCGAKQWMPLRLLPHQLLKDGNDRLFFYASNTAGEPTIPPLVLDSPLAAMRAWGWLVYRNGFSGAINWEVDYRANCVKNPACSGDMLNLDANLIYRGEELGLEPDVPVASIRLKTLRRGAQDVALLRLLAKKEPKIAAEIAARLLPETFIENSSDNKYGLWPVSGEPYELARTAILDRLANVPEPMSIERIPVTSRPVDAWRKQLGRISIALGCGVVLVVFFRTRRRVRELSQG
ncbi:MAG: glycoside hydrolase domain-containing protein [Myxococcota bacterium]|nr:glycoside hydrolase domain-containing protein [Myxococcota bacterium]